MHRMNNVVIMQTKQLGRTEALEEELHSSKAKTEELERKMEEQDCVITNLVGDNLDHLQDNMQLTTHINSSQEQMSQLEHWLGQVRSVLIGMIEGVIEREGTMDSLEAKTLGAFGRGLDDQGGGTDNVDTGAFMGGEHKEGQPNSMGGWVDRGDREGGDRGWTWGVVQWESGGHPGELEWVQL